MHSLNITQILVKLKVMECFACKSTQIKYQINTNSRPVFGVSGNNISKN